MEWGSNNSYDFGVVVVGTLVAGDPAVTRISSDPIVRFENHHMCFQQQAGVDTTQKSRYTSWSLL